MTTLGVSTTAGCHEAPDGGGGGGGDGAPVERGFIDVAVKNTGIT